MDQFTSTDLAKIVDDVRRWVVTACGSETAPARRAREELPEGKRDSGGPGP